MKGIVLVILTLTLLGTPGLASRHRNRDKRDKVLDVNASSNGSLNGANTQKATQTDSENILPSVEIAPPPKPKILTDGEQSFVVPDYVNTEVNKYIEKILGQDPKEFNITLSTEKDILKNQKVFENFESTVLVKMMHGFLRSAYGNVLEVGEAGSGKTTDLQKLALFFSYGAVPNDVRKELQMDNPMLKQFYDSRIGHTQVIDVSIELIGRDNTLRGKAFASQDERMKQIIKELFAKAQEDFKKTGLRTLFVFDEVGTYPDLVQQTLKRPLDKTGYKNLADEFESSKDTGLAALALTTYSEIQKLIKADTAIERRYFIITRENMSDEKALSILGRNAEGLPGKFGEVTVSKDALQYLVKVNQYINSPPQAKPASTNNALDDFVSWFIFNRSENGVKKNITLLDAQAWFVKRLGLSDNWLPGPNGEPPFYNVDIAAALKSEIKGQDEAMDELALPFEAWATLGFLGGPPPTVLLAGVTAAGKSKAIKVLNRIFFDNPNENLRFSIGGKSGYTFRQLFQGSESSGSNPGAMPLVLQGLEGGLGILNLDEGADAPSMFYSELKVVVEKQVIEPIGFDRRPRPWFLPIIISGQWGEHLVSGLKTDEEVHDRVQSLRQKDIEEAFLHPVGFPEGYGVLPVAFLQRVKKNGGVVFMPPTPRASYSSIVDDIYIKEFVRVMKIENNLGITFDPSVTKETVRQALVKDEDPRGLEASFIRLVRYGLTKASKLGIPVRNANLVIAADATGMQFSVLEDSAKTAHVDFSKILSKLDLCALQMTGLKAKP